MQRIKNTENERKQSPLLKVDNLSVGYRRSVVLENVSFTLEGGRILTFIGPNGSGKSTLLKTLIRQLEPLDGVAVMKGRDLWNLDEKELAKSMSIVMTERIDPELMTCGEVVSFGRYPYTGMLGRLSAEDIAKVEEAMETVRVTELKDVYFSQISDGQRQRVMLAKAICQEPDVMILDEPTSFLDIRYKLEFLSILKELAMQRGIAVLMTLHELDLAQKISDEVIAVRDGGIFCSGTPEEVFTEERIEALYDLGEGTGGVNEVQSEHCGSYLPDFGTLELRPASGAPEVFVLGGGGSGIPVYRQLWRRGVPFAAGVLPRSDLEYPVARGLAGRLFDSEPFEPVPEEAVRSAGEVLKNCRKVICCLDPVSGFGTVNAGNRKLLELAAAWNIPVTFSKKGI